MVQPHCPPCHAHFHSTFFQLLFFFSSYPHDSGPNSFQVSAQMSFHHRCFSWSLNIRALLPCTRINCYLSPSLSGFHVFLYTSVWPKLDVSKPCFSVHCQPVSWLFLPLRDSLCPIRRWGTLLLLVLPVTAVASVIPGANAHKQQILTAHSIVISAVLVTEAPEY